jgi:Ca2+-binding RTX toxin-like protein
MPSFRIIVSCLLAVLALACAAAPASAATVSVSGSLVAVVAQPGEANQLTVSTGAGSVTVAEAGAAPLAVGAGCVAESLAVVTCLVLAPAAAAIDLGDGDDTPAVTGVLPATITDGEGADAVTGGPAADVLVASPGADRYRGGGGADTVDYGARTTPVIADADNVADDGDAGEADDVGSDVERLIGGAAGDRLTGSGADDVLEGGAGDDTLTGGSGADRLDGGAGDDTLTGGSGNDTVDYSARTAAVTVDLLAAVGGAAGERDALSSIQHVLGGAGNDALRGDNSGNRLIGGAGDDRLDGRRGADLLDGGDGSDTADYSARAGGVTADLDGNADDGEWGERDDVRPTVEHLLGGAGNDTLTGDDDANTLDGGAGNDKLRGQDGDDAVTGGDGNDQLWGDAGADRLTAGTGDDLAWGGDGADSIAAGDGADQAWGGTGGDAIAAGDGADQAWGGTGDDAIAAEGGSDQLSGDDGADALDGGAGADTMSGGNDADVLAGGEGNDSLNGGGGDDRLSGGDGNDRAWGGDGGDVLAADAGADELWGDGGRDTVDYAARAAALVVTPDDKPGDGEAGENDDVRSSVEVVIGGAGADRLTGSGADDDLYGEGGGDQLSGEGGRDRLFGGAGDDRLTGGADLDQLDGGDGKDRLSARDGLGEPVLCGPGRDTAFTDRPDRPDRCERVETAKGGGAAPVDTMDPAPAAGRLTGVRKRTGGGRFVPIPGFDAERIDVRLLADIAYLRAKYRIAITDGLAMNGHAPGGEHPRGLAIDIVPGPGGSWDDVDRLAKWAEPRQNHPRAPFRWVGYDGDVNHGRGHHLHLSWRHSGTPAGRPARTVWTLDVRALRRPNRVKALGALAARSNHRLGRTPSVRSGLASPRACSGTAGLVPIWKRAGQAFGISWKVLAGITEVESGHGCNLGPSSAGAIGWTQFMPATWRMWGMDANGDRRAQPGNAVDAIYSSARYLRASGAPRSYRRALYAYNHAWWYVDKVLKASRKYR